MMLSAPHVRYFYPCLLRLVQSQYSFRAHFSYCNRKWDNIFAFFRTVIKYFTKLPIGKTHGVLAQLGNTTQKNLRTLNHRLRAGGYSGFGKMFWDYLFFHLM